MPASLTHSPQNWQFIQPLAVVMRIPYLTCSAGGAIAFFLEKMRSRSHAVHSRRYNAHEHTRPKSVPFMAFLLPAARPPEAERVGGEAARRVRGSHREGAGQAALWLHHGRDVGRVPGRVPALHCGSTRGRNSLYLRYINDMSVTTPCS